LKLRELAERLECRLEGDGDVEIIRVARIEEAGPGDLTFFANPRYSSEFRVTRASAVILGEGAPVAPCAMLRTPEPYLVFAHAVALFAPALPVQVGIHPLSSVAPDALVDPSTSVGPFASIASGASIGARTVVHSHASIGPGASVGDDCVVHRAQGCRSERSGYRQRRVRIRTAAGWLPLQDSADGSGRD
jgi:UDP-3-O-[3-hydroxymyristoyl] glucosamine N-acyltransferase